MPSNGVEQADQPKEETLYGRCTKGQKILAEILAETVYDCSLGGFLRHLTEEDGHEKLDKETTEAILSGEISEDEAYALIEEEKSVADITGDSTAAVADGGSATQPENYSAQITTAELEQTGRELSWDELREIVSDPQDGGVWSDTLKIHPDRVPENAFTRRQKPATRILVAMARSKAETFGDVLPSDELADLIDTYCLHLTDRANQDRGKAHIRRTYHELVEQHLWEHPNPTVNTYYTTEDRYHEAIETTIQEDIQPELVDDTPVIFNKRAWSTASDTELDKIEWHDDVGDHLEAAATARTIANQIDHATLVGMDFQLDDDAQDACHHFMLLEKRFTHAYEETVPEQDRKDIETHFVSDGVLTKLDR